MGMPTEEELKEALAEAGRMREKGEDPHHVAKALLSLHYRMRYMDNLLKAAEHYLKFGLSAQEHVALEHAVEAAREAIARNRGGDEEHFGLERG